MSTGELSAAEPVKGSRSHAREADSQLRTLTKGKGKGKGAPAARIESPFLVTVGMSIGIGNETRSPGAAPPFGVDVLLPEDDNSSPAIPLAASFPAGLRFFGTTYGDIFVNNNGNVSFTMPPKDTA